MATGRWPLALTARLVRLALLVVPLCGLLAACSTPTEPAAPEPAPAAPAPAPAPPPAPVPVPPPPPRVLPPPPPVTRSGVVVLLPQAGGGDAAVEVRQGETALLLDQPYAAADTTSAGPQRRTLTSEEVQSTFGAALAAQPTRPVVLTLYFVEQRDEYTEESKRVLESVLARVASYPVPDVVVVGHTDRVGSDAANDALSRRRAETVRAALIRRGLAAENVVAVGRGEREPAVATADGVAEARNRRVEIIVR